jgi:7-cyano-7-deazaguanine synthase
MEATVLLSGGIDSACCVHLLRRNGYAVRGVYVDFGQPAVQMELASVAALARRLDVSVSTISARADLQFGVGELVGRNAFLIFSALLFGKCRSGLLTLGVHSGTNYFDCSPAFFERMDPLVRECTDGKVALSIPFLHWSKDEVYSFFATSGIPLDETYSCEAGSPIACGECASCRDRLRLERWQSVACSR